MEHNATKLSFATYIQRLNQGSNAVHLSGPCFLWDIFREAEPNATNESNGLDPDAYEPITHNQVTVKSLIMNMIYTSFIHHAPQMQL